MSTAIQASTAKSVLSGLLITSAQSSRPLGKNVARMKTANQTFFAGLKLNRTVLIRSKSAWSSTLKTQVRSSAGTWKEKNQCSMTTVRTGSTVHQVLLSKKVRMLHAAQERSTLTSTVRLLRRHTSVTRLTTRRNARSGLTRRMRLKLKKEKKKSRHHRLILKHLASVLLMETPVSVEVSLEQVCTKSQTSTSRSFLIRMTAIQATATICEHTKSPVPIRCMLTGSKSSLNDLTSPTGHT
jgi:hypothetical protein